MLFHGNIHVESIALDAVEEIECDERIVDSLPIEYDSESTLKKEIKEENIKEEVKEEESVEDSKVDNDLFDCSQYVKVQIKDEDIKSEDIKAGGND